MFDGKKARAEAQKQLAPELQQILEDYSFLIGHAGSEALCECLSEILGGRTVRYCGGLVDLGIQSGRLNVKVDKNGAITELFFE